MKEKFYKKLKIENTPLVFDGIDEQALFLAILNHDARGGHRVRVAIEDGCVVDEYATRDMNKLMTTMKQTISGGADFTHAYRKEAVRFATAENFSWNTDMNLYCTVNTMKGVKRRSDEVYNYSAIYVDLDGHNLPYAELHEAIQRTIDHLNVLIKTDRLSGISMVTTTGRGLGLYFVLDKSIANTDGAEKQIKYYLHVQEELSKKIKLELDSVPGLLTVDTSVGDGARLCRLPMTLNQNNGEWCHLIHVSRLLNGEVKYCSLRQLVKENHLDDVKESKQTRSFGLVNFEERLTWLENLQRERKDIPTGYRHVLLEIYYSTSKQAFKGDAQAAQMATIDFNNGFSKPVKVRSMNSMFRTVDRVKDSETGEHLGYYKYSTKHIVEVLNVTQDEMIKCGFRLPKGKSRNKEVLKPRQNAEKRNQIADYLRENPNITYSDAGVYFGVSESTIKRIAAAFNITRYKQSESVDTLAKPVTGISHKDIADYIATNPNKTYKDIAACFCVSEKTVKRVAKEFNISRYNKPLNEDSTAKMVEESRPQDKSPVKAQFGLIENAARCMVTENLKKGQRLLKRSLPCFGCASGILPTTYPRLHQNPSTGDYSALSLSDLKSTRLRI